ncbi:MAG: hypothetical protein PVI59_08190 [Anaerolineae bacterium]|jgi:hypothetical protein
MGLTFVAIGLLVAAMIALTRWLHPDEKGTERRSKSPGAMPGAQEMERMETAAAVAVALALAQASRRAHPVHAWHSARPEEDPSAWQAYSRGQQLEQRKTHQSLRW